VAEAKERASKLPTFAKVVAEHPETQASQESYHNIKGPVWVFEIKFKEVNGIWATIDQARMTIHATDGTVWGDKDFLKIFDDGKPTKIELAPYGTGSYTTWVNSTDCKLCGGKLDLDYKGTDDRGNPLTANVSFTLAR
jgi:hypothetical protein